MSANRRMIAPEFYAAVERGLQVVGSGRVPPREFAIALWVNPLVAVRSGGALCEIDNPHFQGANVDQIEKTIKAMDQA